jgi:DNA-binding transcriptional LysR family regulator
MNQLDQLRTFLQAYRAGSISKAAVRVGITQPAASAHVRSLETALGRALFERGARGLTPTPAADDLARSVAPHLDALDDALAAAKARSSEISGTVHMAGPAEFMSERLMPQLVPLIAEGLSFRVRTGGRERIYELLEAGEVDLAVTASEPRSKTLGYAEIARERLLLVAPPAMAGGLGWRALTPELLAALPMVAYDDELPLVREAWRHLFGAAPELRALATIPDLRAVAGLVRKGAGWSVLPDYLCEASLAAGELALLVPAARSPANALNLVWSKGALRHPRIAYMREQLISMAEAHRL